MARYIIMDNASGYIWADTADMDHKHVMRGGTWEGNTVQAIGMHAMQPCDVARWIDETLGEYDRDYEEVSRSELASNDVGYLIYRADVGGSEALPVITDGQDADTIAAVDRLCVRVATVRVAIRP